MTRTWAASALLGALALVPTAPVGNSTVVVRDASDVSAIVVDGDAIVFARRLVGRVVRVGADGRAAVLATVPISTPVRGQRGLLGLALANDRRLFVSYVSVDGRLVVGALQLDGTRDVSASLRLLWVGPRAADLANGGTLRLLRDRLLLSLGQNITGDGESSGRVLSLPVPKGPVVPVAASAVRVAVAGQWHNPFAFDVARGSKTDVLWVADNAPRDDPERLVRVRLGGRAPKIEAEALGSKTAPSSLVSVDDRHVALCGYVSHRLELIDVRASGVPLLRGRVVLADDCAVGLALASGRRLVYGTGSSIRSVGLPPT